jgi:hypothetical protein
MMIAAALAAAGLLAGCTTHTAPPISKKQLALTRSFRLYTIYWAGRKLDRLPVTAADGPRSYDSNIGMTVYYGNCEHSHALLPNGCKLPLKITTVLFVPHSNSSLGPRRKTTLRGVPAVIFDDGNSIELYTDRMAVDVVADTPRRALEAVAHLTPLNSPLPAGWPALPPPEFKPGVSAKQLAAEAGASGSTGTVSPPGDLQPSVNATQ